MAAKKKQSKQSFSFPKAEKARTKAEIERQLAETIGIAKKDVNSVFLALNEMISQDLNKLGMFTLPGLGKITVVKKLATKSRQGVNPFTGEPMVIKAKPARKVVRIRALKNLKDAVN